MTALSRFNLMFLAGLLTLMCAAHAKISPRDVGGCQQRESPVVFDASNSPHIFYQGPDYRPYHAWLNGMKWQRELIDPAADSGFGVSSAIDPSGVIHVSYGAYQGPGLPKLVYARHDAGGWSITNVGVDGTDTILRLDADNQPHIYFAQTFQTAYAHRDGSTWIVEDTGLPNTAYRGGFVLDSTGAAHVAYAVGLSGLFYATNDSGSWVSTLLSPEWGTTSIAIDSALVPHVVIAMGTELVHFSKPGDDWTSEVMIDTSMLPQVNMDQISLAVGPGDSLHMLAGASINGVWELPFYIYPNGEGWAIYLLETKNTGYHPVIGPDNHGIMHATYAGALKRNASALRYVALPLADLSGTWQDVVSTERNAVTTITGSILVQNTGDDTSAKSKVALWISSDDTLSDDDQLLATAPTLKSIKPDASALVKVKLRFKGTPPDGYLIAHLDPDDNIADANAVNNIIVTPLPP